MTRRYTRAEMHEYTPPTCPHCGATGVNDWIDATMSHEVSNPRFIPGRSACPTDGCVNNPYAPVSDTPPPKED